MCETQDFTICEYGIMVAVDAEAAYVLVAQCLPRGDLVSKVRP